MSAVFFSDDWSSINNVLEVFFSPPVTLSCDFWSFTTDHKFVSF